MNRLKNSFYSPKFSHIYVEEEIVAHPMTQEVLQRFQRSTIIPIRHYKDVFSRTKQSFVEQKKTMKLILAQKKDTFIYEGAGVSQDFGNEHFYYTSSILNCIYNCEYCFLQGMFPSANIVMFINLEDYFEEVKKMLHKHPVYLAISYESDLLALERIAPFASKWLQFAKENPELNIELRTKSANYAAIKHIEPANNLILAWTLSPEAVTNTYEHDTPSYSARLANLKQALEDGWKVRLSFDPILHVKDWKNHYKQLVEQTFSEIPADKLVDVSIGVFRISKDYLKRMRKELTHSAIVHYPYEVKDGVYSYPEEQMQEMQQYVFELVQPYINQEKIFTY